MVRDPDMRVQCCSLFPCSPQYISTSCHSTLHWMLDCLDSILSLTPADSLITLQISVCSRDCLLQLCWDQVHRAESAELVQTWLADRPRWVLRKCWESWVMTISQLTPSRGPQSPAVPEMARGKGQSGRSWETWRRELRTTSNPRDTRGTSVNGRSGLWRDGTRGTLS